MRSGRDSLSSGGIATSHNLGKLFCRSAAGPAPLRSSLLFRIVAQAVHLMPSKKDQPPPDLRYFKPAGK
jgi:hypothetical protein